MEWYKGNLGLPSGRQICAEIRRRREPLRRELGTVYHCLYLRVPELACPAIVNGSAVWNGFSWSGVGWKQWLA